MATKETKKEMRNLLGLWDIRVEEISSQWIANYCCVPGRNLSIKTTEEELEGQVEDLCAGFVLVTILPKGLVGSLCYICL